MAMSDGELMKLAFFMRRRIDWDPVPPWLRLTELQMRKFNDLQMSLNAKIAQIETQKMLELGKIAGISLR